MASVPTWLTALPGFRDPHRPSRVAGFASLFPACTRWEPALITPASAIRPGDPGDGAGHTSLPFGDRKVAHRLPFSGALPVEGHCRVASLSSTVLPHTLSSRCSFQNLFLLLLRVTG